MSDEFIDDDSEGLGESFMTPHYHRGNFYLVEMMDGSTECVPQQVCGKVKNVRDLKMYLEGEPIKDQKLTVQSGYIYRMSANGYMDCSCWYHASTELEMLNDLLDMHGSDTDDPRYMYDWEKEVMERIRELESQ